MEVPPVKGVLPFRFVTVWLPESKLTVTIAPLLSTRGKRKRAHRDRNKLRVQIMEDLPKVTVSVDRVRSL